MQPFYFFTGFPGFIATRLIKALLIRNRHASFALLVHPSQMDKAKRELQALTNKGHGTPEQFELIAGDITQPYLAIPPDVHTLLQNRITHVFHLAAIYDLAVPKDLAYQVNVIGTQNVNNWVLTLKKLERYIYFSTAYVSGDRVGKIYEHELTMGQAFKNHYESTKYEAEVLVQSIRAKAPTTIIRPGIVVGDANTGETVKFDGPYFIMRFLDFFSRFPIPYVGEGNGLFNIVPVTYIIDATIHLAHSRQSVDNVYHLTDPNPYRAKRAYELIAKQLLQKEPTWMLPTSMASAALSIPALRQWIGIERETLIYFNVEGDYDNTQAQADLTEAGITCPDLSSYLPAIVGYYQEHRADPEKAIMIT
ncbi:SDR family oxidoreductase [Brevibacillus dissolubilis]|uniref:SDR family oxidoreductase n=1 Tax=Brevibacillus dissolubilis TaxID=1844116 RepID=UPI00111773CD|nr:SDR family oxidoreductase [Brevibacillus dissolubilis]